MPISSQCVLFPVYTPLLCATCHKFMAGDERMAGLVHETTNYRQFPPHCTPFFTVVSLPYHFLNSCHDGLCTTINTDSCGLAISNSCGSIFANCNLSANLENVLDQISLYIAHTLSLPSKWRTPHTPFLWSSTSDRSQQKATWLSALTSPPISSPISHRLVPSAKVNDLCMQAY